MHPPPEDVEAYRVLETILEEEGPNNPYEQVLLYQPEEEDSPDPLLSATDYYFPGSKLLTIITWNSGQSYVLASPILSPLTTIH